MMRSLEIVGETSGNRVIAQAVENARSAIREGQKISTPLAQSGLFPGMVTHMIDIGEETGASRRCWQRSRISTIRRSITPSRR